MNYKKATEWINGFQKFGMKLGLERIRYICRKLSNPQNNYQIIHVGGTNGKGSVCSFLGCILSYEGYQVGIYTSPHLQRFSERIKINNQEVSEVEIIKLVKKIKPIVEEMKKKDQIPTYFEIVTAMAFQFFSDKKVDFAIIEVGLGGRFDATNIVTPIVSVITNVSSEHTNVLGENIREIAFEKSGIIKGNIPVITAAEKTALKVIKEKASAENAELINIDKKKWKRLSYNNKNQEFLVKGGQKEYNVKTKMLGEIQGENITLTIYILDALMKKGMHISYNSIINGSYRAFIPGRMELIQNGYLFLLDGAHNVAGFCNLKNTLEKDLSYKRLILILGILSDKNIMDMLKIIHTNSDIIIVTRSNNPRACEPSNLKRMIINLESKKKVIKKENIDIALTYARQIAKKRDLICVTGSLFTVGEARDILIK